jgi:hypothetical protein
MKVEKEEKLSDVLGDKHNENRKRIDVVLVALRDDEWVDYIDHWRKNNLVKDEEYSVPAPALQSVAVDSSGEAARQVAAVSIGNELVVPGNGGRAEF